MRGEPRPGRQWHPAGNELLNALTIGLLVLVLPVSPGPGDHYLTASIVAFSTLAVVNHLFPRRLARVTHGVKAAYTHVLFASLAPAGSVAWPSVALVVSGFDLLPLWARSAAARRGGEALGASVRWGLVALGLARLHAPGWLLAGFAACTLVYALERRDRLARGRRHDYGLRHCFEHFAVWMVVLAVNAPRLDPSRALGVTAAVLLATASGLVLLGGWTNRRCLRRLRRALPGWFDPRLRPFIIAKARANASSGRWQHYVCKPFTPTILVQRIDWSDIERMLDRIELPERFDVVVGVLSGGAFIARYLAERRGIERVLYIRSRLWSGLPMWRNAVIAAQYYRGRAPRSRVAFLDGAPDLAGQRVLVVDDSVCTGATMASVRARCLECGALRVATLALFRSREHPTDYAAVVSKTPMIWPWGWEAD